MPTALVTGAGVRVGRAVARALAGEGFDLLLHVNASRTPAESLAEEVRALGRKAEVIVADLSTAHGQDHLAAETIARAPALDALVHNAGLFERVAFEEIDRERFSRMLGVNLEAPFFVTRALLPALRAAPAPSVIHVTDIAGERPYNRYAHYSVSKAGLLMLTRALAVELAPHVRVNAVSPGTVAFPEDFDEAQRDAILRRVPLAREGRPDDIAGAVLYLVRAPYVTGQVINVDGGRSVVL